MSEMKLTVSEIKELMEKMSRTGLTALELSEGDFSLTLRAEQQVVAALETAVRPVPRQEQPAAPAAEEVSGNVVKSPLVGTYYAKPAPDKPDFVTVGQQVKKGDVLFIVESMKLMNEIQSDYTGTVREILAQNGQSVEYGQPILVIE